MLQFCCEFILLNVCLLNVLQIVEEIVGGIAEKIPPPFNVQEVMEKYPVLYEESMNTVLTQEVIR